MGTLLPRERQKHEYQQALVERYKHLPDVKRISRHRHLPTPIYKVSSGALRNSVSAQHGRTQAYMLICLFLTNGSKVEGFMAAQACISVLELAEQLR